MLIECQASILRCHFVHRFARELFRLHWKTVWTKTQQPFQHKLQSGWQYRFYFVGFTKKKKIQRTDFKKFIVIVLVCERAVVRLQSRLSISHMVYARKTAKPWPKLLFDLNAFFWLLLKLLHVSMENWHTAKHDSAITLLHCRRSLLSKFLCYTSAGTFCLHFTIDTQKCIKMSNPSPSNYLHVIASIYLG